MSRAVYILSLALLVINVAAAQVPETISFQGLLTDDEQHPVADGKYELHFSLYQVGSPTVKWTESQTVLVHGGTFGVELGSFSYLENIDFSVPLELGFSVESSDELSPRIALTSSPYALSLRGLRVIPSTDISYDAVNLVGGGTNNSIGSDVGGATIGGGGGTSSGFEHENHVDGDFGTIAGGLGNTVHDYAGAILGGAENEADDLATVGGVSKTGQSDMSRPLVGAAKIPRLALIRSLAGGTTILP